MSGARLLAYLVVGVVVAAGYVSALRLNTRLYLARGRLAPALALQIVRLVGIAAVFWWLAHRGAGALIGGFAGFMVGRLVLVARTARERER